MHPRVRPARLRGDVRDHRRREKRATRTQGQHLVGGYIDGGYVVLYAGTQDDLVSVSLNSSEFDALRQALSR